jgi:hypothetical protein
MTGFYHISIIAGRAENMISGAARGRMPGTVMLVAILAGCGGRIGGAAPNPATGPLHPVIAREGEPDPVPRMDPTCDEDFTVADARPVTATTVGHYYIENGGLVYVVFLRGAPAWYGEMRDWQIPPTPASESARTVGIAGFNYNLRLDAETKALSVLDERVDLRRSNVVFLDRVGNDVVVRGGELMNLCWASPPDAVGQVLSRSRAAVAFVTGRAVPPPRPPAAPTRAPARPQR